ncbi:MAG: ankyrin repeat domain-containing protein [Candidatus Promineifilaceae bacterium]
MSAGADVNSRTGEGDTALIIAARQGSLEIVELLLANGADWSLQGTSEYKMTALMEAASGGHVAVGQTLLDHGADIHQGDRDGLPAMNYAAYYGRIEFVQMLIDNGADVNHRTTVTGWEDNTALFYAIQQGHPDVEALLRANGATD